MQNRVNIVVREACEKGLAEGVFSGVSAAVSVVQKKVRYRGWFSGGVTRYDQLGVPVNPSTLFDLASLTKPLCTTLCTLTLIMSGKMQGDDTCLSLLKSNLPPEKKYITIFDILNHSSGLPAYFPYFSDFNPHFSKKNILLLLDKILTEPLMYPPKTTCCYSDLGFILLGQVIEKIAGQPLEQFYRQHVTGPLQLAEHLLFLPLDGSVEREKKRIAATEHCSWRQTTIQGEVHDEHCWLMGGVAGHAGLFGTVAGVLRLCECLLDCWRESACHPAFSNDLLRLALQWQSPAGNWRLGFDTPSPGQSSSGRYFSPYSVGHLGFTGTSFWMDPEKEVIVVLLTNRVHPSRENIKIREFRPYFHDYLLERIGFG